MRCSARKQPGVGARPPAAGTPRGPSGLGGKNQRAKARPGADPYGYVGRRVWYACCWMSCDYFGAEG